MSGHSKWSTIKHKKGAADAKRGKVFTKHSKLITIAAREGGGDMEINSTLRMLVQKARKDNMPNDRIDKSVKVGTGEIKSDSIISEILYEGYGPGGVAILVQALTDNNNRTLTNIRTIISKAGGSLGKAGCVAYLFDRKGVFVFDNDRKDELEEFAIMNGAEDIKEEEDVIVIYTGAEDFGSFMKAVSESDFEASHFELTFVPNSTSDGNEKLEEKIENLVELLDDDDDVSSVITNLE